MKTSPLQLKWVTYPEASYEANTDFEGDESLPTDVEIDAEVRYALDGNHSAYLTIKTSGDCVAAYRFHVVVVAGFTFDLEAARDAYKPKVPSSLPTIIAMNVTRVLYSSAREQIAMLTARAPYSSVVLKAVLIESGDVTIKSPGASPEEVLLQIFGVSEEELAETEGRTSGKKKRGQP